MFLFRGDSILISCFMFHLLYKCIYDTPISNFIIAEFEIYFLQITQKQ